MYFNCFSFISVCNRGLESIALGWGVTLFSFRFKSSSVTEPRPAGDDLVRRVLVRRNEVDSIAGHWGRRRLLSQGPSYHLSAGRGFSKEGEGKQDREIKGRGLTSSLRADWHSPLWRGSQHWPSRVLGCVILVSCHPGFLVVEGQQISQDRGDEGQSLLLFKLAPRILMQMCCLSESHILEWAVIETVSKGRRGGYSSPLCSSCTAISNWLVSFLFQRPHCKIPLCGISPSVLSCDLGDLHATRSWGYVW